MMKNESLFLPCTRTWFPEQLCKYERIIKISSTSHVGKFVNAIAIIRMLVYIELMYRGPSRGPCTGTIYPTLLGFEGIHHIILSYSFLELTTNIEFHVESSIEPELLLMFGPVVSLLSTIFQKVSTFYRAAF